jgi:hypothetical protein
MTAFGAAGLSPGTLVEFPSFGLRKTWVDPEPGIEMVQIQFACSPVGEEPDWESSDTMVLPPDPSRPGVRSAVLDVPRSLPGAPREPFSLHHFFFVVRRTERFSSPVYTEEVVPHEVVVEDDDGSWTHVGVSWQVSTAADEPAAAANYTVTAMDGLGFGDPDGDSAGTGGPVTHVFDFVRAQPLPHVFRGLVWGPRGSTVTYALHLVRSGCPNPADDTERWDDNDGQGWSLQL